MHHRSLLGSPMQMYGLFVCHFGSILSKRFCFFGEIGCPILQMFTRPPLEQRGHDGGTLRGAFSSSFRGSKLFPSNRLYLVPPGCRACRDTPAGTPANYAGAGRQPLGASKPVYNS